MDRFEHGMVVRDLGAGGRGTLLWIHGLGESGLCFERVLLRPELQGFRHLVPDLPGYGRSHWPFVDQPAEFANALVRQLEEEHP